MGTPTSIAEVFERFADGTLPRETDWFLTRMFAQHLVKIEDETWCVVEVAHNGQFLAYRYFDAPYYARPGVAYHRWFDGSALIEEIQDRWER
jgi:hypothetical protein